MEEPNFVEVRSVGEANRIDLSKYTFVGLFEDRGYVFKIRQVKVRR